MALREVIGSRALTRSGGGRIPSLIRLWSSDSTNDSGTSHDEMSNSIPENVKEEDSIDEVKRKELEFVAMGFTERQASYLSPDPGKARLPRLTRKEAGSYGRPDLVAQYVKEMQQGLSLPQGASMYNLDGAMPEILDPKCPEFDAMKKIKDEHPEMSPVEIAKLVGFEIVDSEVLKDSSLEQLKWTFRSVLVPLAAGEEHPVNSKVTCEFDIGTFQKHYSLSDDAVKYIAQICDSRYDELTGKVTLISDRFESREENKEHLEKIIQDLVKEGAALYPKKTRRKTGKAQKEHVSSDI